MNSFYYNETFYKHLESNKKSAQVIVPIILELVNPTSIVDIGCGNGQWLSSFVDNGIEDVLGVDSSIVPEDLLKISKSKFFATDLREPLVLQRKFDLAISLEVAEHISKENEEVFLNSISNSSDIILFSAAIPYQKGVDHVNVNWQDYWVKSFFHRGYSVVDCIRKRIWQNTEVKAHYAQNILLFVKTDILDKYPKLKNEHKLTNLEMLSIVHPRKYLQIARDPNWTEIGLRRILNALPEVFYSFIKKKFNFKQ